TCGGKNVIYTSLAISQTPISKSKNGDVDGGVVEVKRLDNPSSSPSDLTPTVLSDTDEYHTILKNKLHQVCVIVVLFYASAMKVEGSSAQVEIQALQSEPIFKVHSIQEQGEPDNGISTVSTTQKMLGSQVRQAIVRTNDRCAVMGKVSPNEYSFIRVPVANDPIDDFNGILKSELFNSSSIVYACCSPHIPKASVVLLENSALFFFDLVSYVNCQKLNGYVKRSKLKVLWDDSKADGFQFVLASKILLLLCDVCKPMVPLLCWVRDLDNPCFIDVIRLFCYGPLSTNEGSIATEISKFYKPFLSKDLSKLNFDVAHREPLFKFKDSLLYSSGDDEYEFPKWFKDLNLDYLCGYLNDNLAESLGSRMQKSHKDFQQMESINLDFHEIFLPCCNTKWSHKMQPNDSLVGHVLPLPILLALQEFCNGCPDLEKMCGFSLDVEFGFRFNEVMRVTTEMVVSDFCLLNNDETVFLAYDNDEM
ncbi:hypothetical protein Godav_013219, partial [Gossypium davidsonii]|nr:hypothetical protein [Gossypium davidsonii]